MPISAPFFSPPASPLTSPLLAINSDLLCSPVPSQRKAPATQAIVLAPVVQTLDSVIHRINHYPADKYQGNQLCYPLDRLLSCGQRYPTFEQPQPGVWSNHTKVKYLMCCVQSSKFEDAMTKQTVRFVYGGFFLPKPCPLIGYFQVT